MSKKIQKRKFKKKNEIYKPQTLGCPYCGGKAILRPVSYLFGDSINATSSEYYYVCTNYPSCNAYIPCQHGNFVPNGVLANPQLRNRRTVAHRYINLIVSNKIMPQKAVYYVISGKLGISEEKAHIRYATDHSIEQIIAILRQILDNHGIGYNLDVMESSEYVELKAKGVLWEVLKNEAQKTKKEESNCVSTKSKEAC